MLWALQELNLRPHAYQAERMSHDGANNADASIDAPVPPASASGVHRGCEMAMSTDQSGHCASLAGLVLGALTAEVRVWS